MYPRPEQVFDSTAGAGPHAAELWDAVPFDTDILVTHTPAYTLCDDSLGCRDLRTALARVRPRLHVCGHVHQARGASRVRWDTGGLSAGDPVPARAAVEVWQDPHPDLASAKMSLVDLTARGGKRPLDFHDPITRPGAQLGHDTSRLPMPAVRIAPARRDDFPSVPSEPEPKSDVSGLPSSVDRAGRRETCVINCAIAATSWPHTGGKRYHKPIVVDIDLPVWR